MEENPHLAEYDSDEEEYPKASTLNDHENVFVLSSTLHSARIMPIGRRRREEEGRPRQEGGHMRLAIEWRAKELHLAKWF